MVLIMKSFEPQPILLAGRRAVVQRRSVPVQVISRPVYCVRFRCNVGGLVADTGDRFCGRCGVRLGSL